MRRTITFQMKLGAGFAATIVAALAICAIALYGLSVSMRSSHTVISDYAQDLILAGRLGVEEETRVAAGRGFLITGDKTYLENMKVAHSDFLSELEKLQQNNITTPHDEFLRRIRDADESYEATLGRFIRARQRGEHLSDITQKFETQLQPLRDNLKSLVRDYISFTSTQLDLEKKALSDSNRAIYNLVLAVSLIALLLAGAMAIIITKTLSNLYLEIQNTAKMREEIVEVVAHDLRNPIAAVNLSVQLLIKMSKTQGQINLDDLRRRAENISRAAGRLNGLVESLLDLAKIKAGTLNIDRASVLPFEILDNTYEMFENIAMERNVALEVKGSPDLPVIQCDRERIIQVFSNLIGNALKFSASGKKIIFGGEVRGSEFVFYVTDQGPGIPINEQAFVFERYWQTGTQKKAGAGLGLAICKGIVTAHAGRIWLESRAGVGTTFYFSIPMS